MDKKNIAFYENMTFEMKEIAEEFFDEQRLKTEFLSCYEKYVRTLKASQIELPSKTENGNSVLHGARVQMTKIADYWDNRVTLIIRYLDDNWLNIQIKAINSKYNLQK